MKTFFSLPKIAWSTNLGHNIADLEYLRIDRWQVVFRDNTRQRMGRARLSNCWHHGQRLSDEEIDDESPMPQEVTIELEKYNVDTNLEEPECKTPLFHPWD